MTLFIAILLLNHMGAKWYIYIVAIVLWFIRTWYYTDKDEDAKDMLKAYLKFKS